VLAVSTFAAVPAAGDAAKDARDAQQLVERTKFTVEGFAADGTVGPSVRNLIKKAKGVYIASDVLRGAFIVGACHSPKPHPDRSGAFERPMDLDRTSHRPSCTANGSVRWSAHDPEAVMGKRSCVRK